MENPSLVCCLGQVSCIQILYWDQPSFFSQEQRFVSPEGITSGTMEDTVSLSVDEALFLLSDFECLKVDGVYS